MDEFLEDRIYETAQLCGFITCFNVEEHAVMLWNMHREKGVPKDLEKLLEDARYIKIMYQNLALHMRDLKKELEEE